MVLSRLSILSFEIGTDCNLKKLHTKCPINSRMCRNCNLELTIDKICESIEWARANGFNGYVAFHFYNEPLLYRDKIEKIIDRVNDVKYLLWTNGLLLNRNIKDNSFLRKFDRICITKYFESDSYFFEQLKDEYENIIILDNELDDRLCSYERTFENRLGCKRPLFELPIDYHGNVYLCCYDWKNSVEIGNIIETSLETVVSSAQYQKILEYTRKRLFDPMLAPKICSNCNHAMINPKEFWL